MLYSNVNVSGIPCVNSVARSGLTPLTKRFVRTVLCVKKFSHPVSAQNSAAANVFYWRVIVELVHVKLAGATSRKIIWLAL